MALIDGQEATLNKLDRDIFELPDGSKVDPTRVQLDITEMQGLTESGQAGALLEKYEPVVSEDEKYAGFRLRTNHERYVYRRQIRAARAKAEREAKEAANASDNN